MPLRAAIGHPFGLALLGASLAVAAAMLLLPGLTPWSGRAVWVVLWGVLTYGVAVVVLRRSRPGPAAPELEELYAIRAAMASLHARHRREEARSHPSELTRVLAEAIVQLDEQVIPALRQLIQRRQGLSGELALFDSGKLHTPDLAKLELLRALHTRQQRAIDECVGQAANVHATLVALLQEGDDASVAEQARTLAEDLLTLYDALAEVLRGGVELELEDAPSEPVPESDGPAIELRLLPDQSRNGASGDSPEQFTRATEEALRRLNNPAALVACDLTGLLPYTLEAARSRRSDASPSEATPLEQAKALSQVLVSAIDQLKPVDAIQRTDSAQALQYHIIYEEYVLGWSNNKVMTRHSISESTFHRRRREAIAILAREIKKHEERLLLEKADTLASN